MMTPDFPAWSGSFACHLRRLRSTTRPALHQLEMLFTPWIAPSLLAQQDEGDHSRDRCWNLRLVFWTFLWQVAQAGASCREAIRQAQALCRCSARPVPPDKNSPYCQSHMMSLATGMLTAWAGGNLHLSELALLQSLLWDYLRAGDVLLGDRGFCNWGLLAQCVQRDRHAVFRVKGSRRRDFRRGKRLSKEERLVQWSKPAQRATTIDPKEWAALPPSLTLRLVRCRLHLPGFRTRQVILVTTLLDSAKYPPAALAQLYYRRWAMELTLRNLKSTLQMDHLSCKTPENLDREIRMHFLVHNLVRRLMLETARRHGVPLDRISFAGSLAVARRYGEAFLQARSASGRRQLHEDLLQVLADDLVPDRPGRREPRAVKRRPKPYPRLMRHRHTFREIQHQNRYRAESVSRPTCRKFSKA